MGILSLERIAQILARVLVLLTAIPVHESAHGLVSLWLGDPTAKNAGRITLNPFRHFDLMGTLCLILGGIGWAKPVPINPNYYRNRKAGMALSALAGPVSNFIMATLSLILLKVIFVMLGFFPMLRLGDTILQFIFLVLYTMVITNVVLCIFNMLPVPPFDGSRIYLIFLPEKWYFGIMKYERIIMIAVFLILFAGILDRPLGIAYQSVIVFLDRATGFLGTLY